VEFIDSILLGQASHKHWKAGGFALKALSINKVALPKIKTGQALGALPSTKHLLRLPSPACLIETP
jgi:hypothetical protein